MITIQIDFPAGRYHATPWDSHPNEGMVEWPPSPWRLLRTMVATWHLKCRDEVEESVMRSLMQKMASAHPEFYLPPATSSHVRHFMPGYRDKDRDRVLNAFLCPLGPAYVRWPILEMGQEESDALCLLVSRTSYLGRSESWVEMKLVEGIGPEPNARPSATIVDLQEGVRLLGPVNDKEYAAWVDKEINIEVEVLAQLRVAKGKAKPTDKSVEKERTKIASTYPRGLWECLQLDTAAMRSSGWSSPPGTSWVQYSRPKGVMNWKPPARRRRADANLPVLAKFGVQSNVAPALTKALSLAERVHDALVSRSHASPIFTGCDPEGRPLRGHRHASIYCLSSRASGSRRGEITEVLVYCPDGFGERERAGLESLTKVWGYGGNDVYLRLHGLGTPSEIDFQGDVFSSSTTWSSSTPFVSTRHAKATRVGVPKFDESGLQIGSPEHDLIRLLMLDGLPRPTSVTRLPHATIGGRRVLWPEFTQDRRHGSGERGQNRGAGFRIEFPVPVHGPIAVGYGCHFGLGLFVPSS